jgi:hypothetical protein
MAGPALAAAAWPMSTKMPAPMMLPTPSAIRLQAVSVRRSGTASASATSTAIGFLAKKCAMDPLAM